MSASFRPSGVLGCALALASMSFALDAAVIERQEVRMSADVCQPALPAFDGMIRKRPLAMQNEGTGNAFLTCGFGGGFNGVPSAKTLSVGFTNLNQQPATVNCTLADAQAGVIDPEYFVKSTTVPATGAPVHLLMWSAAGDNGGVRFTYPAVSCMLPPGVGIQVTNHTYDEEIGD